MDAPHIDPQRLARTGDPSTSHEAAERVAEFSADHHERVLMAITEAGAPVGAEQVADACGLDAYAVRKRLPELQADGLICLAPGTRKTRSGRSERLWQRASPAF